jgi:Cof subfamily protein (haloacid dehalogenase superfamily)
VELIVFDLDGTLLDSKGQISPLTRETLADLSKMGIAYTVATGRTLHASRELLEAHNFGLPQVYKNGVMIWDPVSQVVLDENFLQPGEVAHVLEAITGVGLAAFVFTVERATRHLAFHTPPFTDIEKTLVGYLEGREALHVDDISAMPADANITNISVLGEPGLVHRVQSGISGEPHLVAYSGNAWDGDSWKWLDIHHANASKGGAVDVLRQHLEIERVVCFGDNENDLSMFERADESYAPANATEQIKNAATSIIWHHDDDGIAKFLRQRYGLDDAGQEPKFLLNTPVL